MAKKVMGTIKKWPSKKSSSKEKEIEKVLVENFVSLQKVMTDLSSRFKELSDKISSLLELFEISANALAKKEINFTKPMDEKKIIGKLDSIMDQNKVIARGLTLMHERAGEEPNYQKPLPTSSPQRMPQREEYKKSPFSQGF